MSPSSVAIIVPIFNAFDEALICVRSLLRHSPVNSSILLVDDASPLGSFSDALLRAAIEDPRLQVYRNQANLGFVRSCNLGMFELAKEKDIILLNSDTEVTPGWVEKLQQAAYSRPNIASVTPFTNNGTICSVPKFGEDNPIPPGYSLEQFAALVESVSTRSYPEIPTAVGFCMYIPRHALNRIGGFDAELFSQGYGEENDFSFRASRAGMINILDDATFVYHKGNCSFGTEQIELSKANSQKLRQRFPTFFDDIGRYCRARPLYQQHLRIYLEMIARLSRSRSASVLHILHNGPFTGRTHELGGTELHVQDLVKNSSSVLHWSLTQTSPCYFLTAHLPETNIEFIIERQSVALSDIVNKLFFDLIHIQHTRGYALPALVAALKSHGNFVVSAHDFQQICPRVNLLTPFRTHCSGFECSSMCGYSKERIGLLRQQCKELFGAARRIICFSESTKGYFERILGEEFPFQVVPHGVYPLSSSVERERLAQRQVAAPSPEVPLKVCFLGLIPKHKGSLLIAELLQRSELDSGCRLEWHALGRLFLDSPKNVVLHGEYQRSDLPRLLEDLNPHLVLILSLCPETYCMTLDESWNAGIPALVTPLGAPAERVRASGAGWVLEHLSCEEVLSMLSKISSNWSQYLEVRALASSAPLHSSAWEASQYELLYNDLCATRSQEIESLCQFIQAKSIPLEPVPGLVKRAARLGINQSIRLIEKYRVRPYIERAIYSLLPKRMIDNLKSLR